MEQVIVCDNPEKVAAHAAQLFVEWAKTALTQQDNFTVGLPGGKSPQLFYSVLAKQYRDALPWDKILFFVVDEQCLPLEKMGWITQQVKEELLIPLNCLESLACPEVCQGDPMAAAAGYSQKIREHLNDRINNGRALLDLIVLGMGTDGHTATLFPGAETLRETDRWIIPGVPVDREGKEQWLTMSLPFMTHADRVMFIVTGESKRNTLKNILNAPLAAVGVYPAAMVRPRKDKIWVCDRSAAE